MWNTTELVSKSFTKLEKHLKLCKLKALHIPSSVCQSSGNYNTSKTDTRHVKNTAPKHPGRIFASAAPGEWIAPLYNRELTEAAVLVRSTILFPPGCFF